jgi:hypothetical protein
MGVDNIWFELGDKTLQFRDINFVDQCSQFAEENLIKFAFK